MVGYVVKDKNGIVSESEIVLFSRWVEVKFSKNGLLFFILDLNDSYVYMDEFINYLINKYGKVFFIIGIKGYIFDNEFDLWLLIYLCIYLNKVIC